MLTEEQIYEYRTKYIELLEKLNIDLTDIMKYLNAVDYFNKPATASTFNAFKGGLCKYAVDLCYTLADIANAYFPDQYTKEDFIKVALFRDLYRAELYEPCVKRVRNDATGQWEDAESWKVRDGNLRPTFGDIGFSSYMIAKYFVSFTDEQIEAICCSRDGSHMTDIHEIMRTYRLVTLTMIADNIVSYLLN